MSQTTTPLPSPDPASLPRKETVVSRGFHQAIIQELGPRFRLLNTGIAFNSTACSAPPAICTPFRVACRLWNEVTGWSLVVEIQDPRNRVVECVLPSGVLDGRPREAMAMLAKHGLRVFSADDHRNVLDLIRAWPVSLFATEAGRTGWQEEKSAFVLPTGRVLIRKTASESFRYTGDRASEEIGDLAIWQAGVAALCPGNPVLLFACSVAFAAPLLPFQTATGSRVFHLHGLSGEGKTRLLNAASTVWPRRNSGIRTWRTTVNGLEGAAAEVQHLLLGLDDLPEEPPPEFDAAIYMLGNDGGKSRMSKTTAMQGRLTWKIMILSTGEVSSKTALKAIGKTRRGGQSVRMLDIRVADRHDATPWSAYENLHGHGTGRAFVAALDRAVEQASGPAGAAFVEALLRTDAKAIEKRLAVAIEAQASDLRQRLGISEDDPAETEVRRVIDAFALVAVAGEWASDYGVTGWESGSVTAAVGEIARRWLQERGGTRPIDQMEAANVTREFLERNGNRLITLPVRDAKAASNDREILGYRDATHFYLLSQTFTEIHKGRNIDASARLLEEAGYLERGGERNSLLYRVPKAGESRPRAYRITRAILDA